MCLHTIVPIDTGGTNRTLARWFLDGWTTAQIPDDLLSELQQKFAEEDECYRFFRELCAICEVAA